MFFHPRKVSILNIYRLSTSFFCCELNAPETHRRVEGKVLTGSGWDHPVWTLPNFSRHMDVYFHFAWRWKPPASWSVLGKNRSRESHWKLLALSRRAQSEFSMKNFLRKTKKFWRTTLMSILAPIEQNSDETPRAPFCLQSSPPFVKTFAANFSQISQNFIKIYARLATHKLSLLIRDDGLTSREQKWNAWKDPSKVGDSLQLLVNFHYDFWYSAELRFDHERAFNYSIGIRLKTLLSRVSNEATRWIALRDKRFLINRW